MAVGTRVRLQRLVVAALIGFGSVLPPCWVAADGVPVDPTPKPTYTDLSAPAEVAVSLAVTGYLVLDATTY